MPKGKTKNFCRKCEIKHYPPVGKKCQIAREQAVATEVEAILGDDSTRSTRSSARTEGTTLAPSVPHINNDSVAQGGVVLSSQTTSSRQETAGGSGSTGLGQVSVDQLDCSMRGGHELSQPSVDREPSHLPGGDDAVQIQQQILEQLDRVNRRLDAVERRSTPAECRPSQPGQPRQKLSRTFYAKPQSSRHKAYYEYSESDSDSEALPDIDTIRTSDAIQREVDHRLASLRNPPKSGKAFAKLKSQRGGDVDVLIRNRVAWPHESVLSGTSRQRVTYDQLSLPQFVQGFCKNMLQEPDLGVRHHMLTYLSELMEDTVDFSWQSAKAAHAVLLCDMEQGNVSWQETHKIDRIRRAHAQRHTAIRQNQSRSTSGSKPWFCKQYQSGNCSHKRDHELNGRLQKHICSFCLSLGKVFSHPEKDCYQAKKQPKNE